MPGHVPPRFAVEVVSLNNPQKDYEDAPLKYACLGTRELVIFDPELFGPVSGDGPHVLQIWRLDKQGTTMTRVYAGSGPAQSAELGAWLFPTANHRLRIAGDLDGHAPWQTEAEAEAAARKQAEEALHSSHCTFIRELCDLFGIPFDEARSAHVASLDVASLEGLRREIRRARAWPS